MDINFEHIDFSKHRKACGECGSFDHTSPKCPNKPCSKCNQMGHIYSSCQIVKEERNARKRTIRMSEEQK